MIGTAAVACEVAPTSPHKSPPPHPAKSLLCRGVDLSPSDNLLRRIQNTSARTILCFAPGIYRPSDTIATGDKFPVLDLRAGAIFDGGNSIVGISGADHPPARRHEDTLGGVFQQHGAVRRSRECPLQLQHLPRTNPVGSTERGTDKHELERKWQTVSNHLRGREELLNSLHRSSAR
jgi:hypothetical protein